MPGKCSLYTLLGYSGSLRNVKVCPKCKMTSPNMSESYGFIQLHYKISYMSLRSRTCIVSQLEAATLQNATHTHELVSFLDGIINQCHSIQYILFQFSLKIFVIYGSEIFAFVVCRGCLTQVTHEWSILYKRWRQTDDLNYLIARTSEVLEWIRTLMNHVDS